jgi:ABC-type amino acid transport substrate-binding protein
MKRLIMTAAGFLATVFVTTAAMAGDLDDVKARGVLRHIGLPYANFNTGSGDGMEADLTKLFAKSLGVKYEFVESDWGPLVQDLIGKKVKVTGGKAELLEERFYHHPLASADRKLLNPDFSQPDLAGGEKRFTNKADQADKKH